MGDGWDEGEDRGSVPWRSLWGFGTLSMGEDAASGVLAPSAVPLRVVIAIVAQMRKVALSGARELT